MTTESPPRPKPKTTQERLTKLGAAIGPSLQRDLGYSKPKQLHHGDALRLARKMLAAGGIEIENAHDRWLAEVALTTYLENDIPGSALKAALR